MTIEEIEKEGWVRTMSGLGGAHFFEKDRKQLVFFPENNSVQIKHLNLKSYYKIHCECIEGIESVKKLEKRLDNELSKL